MARTQNLWKGIRRSIPVLGALPAGLSDSIGVIPVLPWPRPGPRLALARVTDSPSSTSHQFHHSSREYCPLFSSARGMRGALCSW